MEAKPEGKEQQGGEELYQGVPARALDGYDGEGQASEEMLAQLMEQAPPELKARIQEFAQQRSEAGEAEEQPEKEPAAGKPE